MQSGTIVDNRFRIDERAGQGGMGIIYRARESTTGKMVAIKVMQSKDPTDRARFFREAQVLSSLSSPTIVACLGHGVLPSDEPWMAMEWVEGEDLATRLESGPLVPGDALLIVQAIVQALEVAHAQGIVHRDLKPANILLEGRDPARARLIDFGIARMRHAHTFTEFGAIVGTPAYMAPEQIRGAHNVDERADLYALGVILFECLTGRPPFLSPSFIGIMTQALFERAPRLRDINPALSSGLDDLVDQLLAKDPQQRLGPASAVREVLNAVDLSHRVSSLPPRSVSLGLTEDELQFVSVVLVSRTTAQPVSVSAETITDRTEGQLIRAIERLAAPFHGRVEGLRDGTVIVAFPARGAATDQAAMAARTALAIRDLGTSLPLALATGRASTQIGSLYSDAAVRAATLSQFCSLDHHAIPIDETTRGLLDMRFSVEQRQGVFFLLAEDALGDVGHLLCGRLAPFVGREREVALIEKIFDDVLEEPQNAAVIVVGEAGAGKSRLGREVVSVLSRMEPKTEIWVARGEAVRAGSSFGMLSSALHRAAGIHDGEPMQVRYEKLTKFVQERVPLEQAPALVTFLGEMTETKSPQANEDDELRAARRDPVLMRDRIRFAFEDLVDAISEQHPLVLLLEDLHWGDMPSIKVLETIFQRLQRRPFFILALGRPEMTESFPNLFAEWSPSTIRLGGLSRRACQALISRIVGTNATDDVVASIVERSAGHPLFLEELVRTVAEGASTPTNALPETVLAMVQSRMAKLPPEARRALRAASVFGEDFWRGGVVALLGATDTPHDVDHSLQLSRDRELIETKRASRFPNQTEFRFRHALFREAAYAMLTDADRTTGHFLAATFLEQVGETNASLLAKHFAEAKEPERAAPYFTRAAREALLGGDFDAVLQHGDWVVENSTESELVGEALGLKAEAAQWRGAYEQSGQLAEVAMTKLASGSSLWFGAAMTLAVVLMRRIQLDKLHALCETLIVWGSENKWSDAFIEAAIRIGLQAYVVGQYEIGQKLIIPLGQLLENRTEHSLRIQALLEVLEAARTTVMWKYDQTFQHSMEAARLLEQIGDLRTAAGQRLDATFTLVDLGRPEQAIEICKDLLVTAQRLAIPRLKSIAKGMLGAALLAAGRLEQARDTLIEAKNMLDTLGDARNGGSMRYKLGRCHRLRKEYDLAEKYLDEAETLLADMPRLRALMHAHKALLFVDMQRTTEALKHARQGMAILQKLGRIGTDEILVRYAYIESLLQAGLQEEARQQIAVARERVLFMANQLTDESFRESFLNHVEENRRVLTM